MYLLSQHLILYDVIDICYNSKSNMPIAKKPILTIAIPAYNEEANIANILENVLNQNQKTVNVKNILVYNDASTDSTPDIVKKIILNYPLIKLINLKIRIGKNGILNRIFRERKSDILVVLDADIGIVGADFLDNISRPIINDKNAQLVSAHQTAIRPKNFIGKIIYAALLLWDYIRFSIPNKDHIQNFYSSATALRGSFVKNLCIPEAVAEERIYLYLMAKKLNGFRYSNDAHVLFWPPSTLSEYIMLSDRTFGAKQPELSNLFGAQANTIHIVPWKYKIIGILKSFFYQPFYTPVAILLGFSLNFLVTHKKKHYRKFWNTNISTKKPIIL